MKWRTQGSSSITQGIKQFYKSTEVLVGFLAYCRLEEPEAIKLTIEIHSHLKDKPPFPGLALHLEATPTTIIAGWTLMDEAQEYVIEWTDGSSQAWPWTALDAAADTFVIDNVLPNTNYTIMLAARSGNETLDTDVESIVTPIEERAAVTL